MAEIVASDGQQCPQLAEFRVAAGADAESLVCTDHMAEAVFACHLDFGGHAEVTPLPELWNMCQWHWEDEHEYRLAFMLRLAGRWRGRPPVSWRSRMDEAAPQCASCGSSRLADRRARWECSPAGAPDYEPLSCGACGALLCDGCGPDASHECPGPPAAATGTGVPGIG